MRMSCIPQHVLLVSLPVFSFRRKALEMLGSDLFGTFVRLVQRLDLHRHIIYQINKHAKPDFVVKVPDLYDRRRRCWRRKRARRQHPEPQEPPHIDIIYIKMTLIISPTSWGRFQTCTTHAGGGGENVPVGSIPSLRYHPK